MMAPQSFEDGEKKPLSVGPWGGQNGHRWDDGMYTGVRQVVIAHGSGIDSIQIEYDLKGSSIWSEKHGGSGGDKIDKVKLDFPNEFLTSVHGYYGSLNEWGSVFVRSLTFQSTKKTYGPFGAQVGTYFSFPMTGGKIVGFHGKSGWFVDAIGVYLKPLQNLNITRTLLQTHNFVANGHEKLEGFSVVQGNVGQSYDIVLAVRQKNDGSNPLAFQNKLPRQNSHSKEFYDVGFKHKVQQDGAAKVQFSEVEPAKGLPTKDLTPKELPKLLPPKVAGSLTFGPWGGNGGISFDDGFYKGIMQIKLSRNVGIVSMKIMYDEDGEAKWGSKHGGTGGFKSDKIVFDYPSEILTHITGTMGSLMYMGPTVIKSLTFYTNKTKYGPFGEEQGPSFTSKLKDGKIVGFHGREGLFLDALGVHVLEGKVPPLALPPPHSTAIVPKETNHDANAQWSNKLVAARGFPTEDVSLGFVKQPSSCGPGPWGADGGRQWDDGVFSGIRQIFVTRGDAICSMQIEYDRNGQSIWSVKHGGDGGIATHRIKLEYPNEVVVCICGYYGSITKDERSNTVIRSLTFYTSRGKYGPYGEETGTYFTSNTTEGKVVGFHGRSSMYLDAIGVHMQHWLGSHKTAKPSLFWKTR